MNLKELEESMLQEWGGQGTADPWGGIYAKAAEQYGLDPAVLRALVQVESSGQVGAVSPKGARGPAQLMPKTAKALGVADPHDPEQAIPAAAKLLSSGLDRWKGDLGKALMEYHGGTDTGKWGPLTKAYPGKIYAALEGLGVEPRAIPTPAPTEAALVPPTQAASRADGLSALEKSILDEWIRPPEAHPAPPQLGSTAEPWGVGRQLASAALLGAGVPLQAGATAAKEAIRDIAGGAGLREAAGRAAEVYYPQARSAIAGQKAAWEKESPGMAITADIAGSLPTTMLGMGALGRLAAPAIDAAGAASPTAANVLKFLSGQAGEGGKGIANWLLRRASQAAEGVTQAVPAAAMTLGLSDRPAEEQLATAAAFGGPIGAATRPAVNLLQAPFRAAVNPQVAKAAQEMERFGVPVYAGQIAESPFLRKAHEKLAAHTGTEQLKSYTKALLGTLGVQAEAATPQVMTQAKEAIGKRLDAVAAKTALDVDAPLTQRLTQIARDIQRSAMPESDQKQLLGLVNGLQKELLAAPGMKVAGKTYQDLTAWGSDLGTMLQSGSPFVRRYSGLLRESLDDALERSMLQVKGGGQAVRELKEVRGQFRNWMLLQDAVGKARPSGMISPKIVASTVEDISQAPAAATRDLLQLGQFGKFLPEVTPQGTAVGAEDLHSLARIAGLGGLGALELGAKMVSPELMVPLGVAGGGALIGKELVEGLMTSPAYANALIANALGRPPARWANPLTPGLTIGLNQ